WFSSNSSCARPAQVGANPLDRPERQPTPVAAAPLDRPAPRSTAADQGVADHRGQDDRGGPFQAVRPVAPFGRAARRSRWARNIRRCYGVYLWLWPDETGPGRL